MNDFSRPRRMSASAFAILFMKSLSEYAGTVFFLVVFLAYKSVGGRSLTEILLSIAAIAATIVALSLATAFWKYYFRKFHIEDGKLIFTHGFASRRTTSLPLDKVHNLRTKSGVLYRILNVSGIKFDTLASEDRDVELILDEGDWRLLLSEIKSADASSPAQDRDREKNKEARIHISNAKITKGALCQNHLKGFAVLAAILSPIFGRLNDLGEDTADRVFTFIDNGLSEYLSSAGHWVWFFAIIYAAVALLWTAEILLRYADMTVVMEGNRFTIVSGLLSRFTCRLSRDKATVITVKQNPLERMAHCQTVTISQAANASSEEKWDKIRIYGTMLGAKILGWKFEGSAPENGSAVIEAKSGRGLFYIKFIPQIAVAAVGGLALLHLTQMPVLAATVGLVYAAGAGIRALMALRHSSISLHESYIRINRGNIARISDYIDYRDIESGEIRYTPFSKFTHRATLRLSTNSGILTVRSLHAASACAIRRRLLNRISP